MQISSPSQRDPLGWCLVVTAAFMVLALWRITMPPDFYFDEIHYVPAARNMLELIPANREHPLFAKEVIAACIHLLGDKPLAWRIGPALFGTLGLFAFSRFVWHLSHRRAATIFAAILLATNFMWFVQSRISMLDMVAAGLCMTALWQFAAALRSRTRAAGRLRLIASGVALGLSLGSKWSGAPALAFPGLTFLLLYIIGNGLPFLGRRGAGPIKDISLFEAAFWLGLVPLMVYWLTYLPAFFYVHHSISPLDFIEQHRFMIQLQDSVKKPHPYQSYWYQWATNWRAIWYLFQEVDGAQRGIVMLGNPFSMLAGLAALAWGIWAIFVQRRHDVLALAALYLLCLMMWAVNGKPVQFYYHYLLPGAFLMGILALWIDAQLQHKDRRRKLALTALGLSVAMFVLFYPIISAAPLPYKQFYNAWMWLPTWR